MLKQRATHAVAWSAVDQLLRQGLFFAISVTMARLVAPEAYGTVAALGLFTGIASTLVDGGLSSALIQKQGSTLVDESTVFWFNLAAGLLMGLALFLCASWIAGFYGIAVLLPITQIYAFQFLLGACNSVQNTLFAKHLDFKTPLKISFVSTLLSASVGIFLAWKGCGVWALVVQSMTSAALQSILLWKLSSWRPAFTFSLDSFRSLFRFGGFLFLSRLINIIYLQFYTLIIGKWYGVHELGIYNRAEATKQLPTGVLSEILSRVAFPIFSQTADDPGRLLRGLRLSIRGAMFLNIPMMLGLACVAEPLILTLFGPVWASAIPLLQILALAGLLWPVHVLNLSLLQAMGHSGKFLQVEIVKKVVGISLVVVGSRYGTHGMAWAMVVSSVFSFVFNAYYSGKLLGYGPWKQAVDFAPALFCGILMASIVIACGNMIESSAFVKLALQCFIGVVAFLLFAKLCRIRQLDEGIHFIRDALLRAKLI